MPSSPPDCSWTSCEDALIQDSSSCCTQSSVCDTLCVLPTIVEFLGLALGIWNEIPAANPQVPLRANDLQRNQLKQMPCFSWDLERLANMPDLCNGSLEGEQYLEQLQVPPSPCTSLKNSSLLCSLSLCWGHCWVTASCFSVQAWTGFSGILSAGFIGEKCPLLHFWVSFSTSRFFIFFLYSPNDCNRIFILLQPAVSN